MPAMLIVFPGGENSSELQLADTNYSYTKCVIKQFTLSLLLFSPKFSKPNG